jgi:predicted Holliday junction resolvase-like endonuclease
MIEWIIILLLSFFLGIVLFLYILQEKRIESRAWDIFENWRVAERVDLDKWKTGELQRLSDEKARILFDLWKVNEEEMIRTDAVRRSQSVIRGKVTEHLIPFFPDFPYNPKDARFLGSPVDLVVFDGLSEGFLREIIFVEIKAGKNSSLSRSEREVRTCVQERRIGYNLLHSVSQKED